MLAYALVAATAFVAPALAQEKVLRIGMTAADIPRSLVSPIKASRENLILKKVD